MALGDLGAQPPRLPHPPLLQPREAVPGLQVPAASWVPRAEPRSAAAPRASRQNRKPQKRTQSAAGCEGPSGSLRALRAVSSSPDPSPARGLGAETCQSCYWSPWRRSACTGVAPPGSRPACRGLTERPHWLLPLPAQRGHRRPLPPSPAAPGLHHRRWFPLAALLPPGRLPLRTPRPCPSSPRWDPLSRRPGAQGGGPAAAGGRALSVKN